VDPDVRAEVLQGPLRASAGDLSVGVLVPERRRQTLLAGDLLGAAVGEVRDADVVGVVRHREVHRPGDAADQHVDVVGLDVPSGHLPTGARVALGVLDEPSNVVPQDLPELLVHVRGGHFGPALLGLAQRGERTARRVEEADAHLVVTAATARLRGATRRRLRPVTAAVAAV
jgi:hypothetical protein